MNRDSISRVIRTFLIAFLGIVIPGALSWLHGLTEWANHQGQTPFPDWHSLAFLGVAAIVAGFVAILNWIVVAVEDWSGRGFLRSVVKVQRGGGGETRIDYVIVVAALTALLVLVAIFWFR